MKSRNAIAAAAFLLLMPGLAFGVGAIAVDDQVGDESPGYGFAIGKDSRSEAEGAAMAQCRKAGNRHCKVAVWFNGCGAYASSKKRYGVGWGKTSRVAEGNALEKCGHSSCEIHVSKCD